MLDVILKCKDKEISLMGGLSEMGYSVITGEILNTQIEKLIKDIDIIENKLPSANVKSLDLEQLKELKNKVKNFSIEVQEQI